jgi:hypothetical protein
MKQTVLMKAFIKLQMLIYDGEASGIWDGVIFFLFFCIEGWISSLHNSLLLGMIS